MTCTCKNDSACSSCPASLVERQEEVVRALQDATLRIIDKHPSGHVKDYAVALGVCVDKLVQLRPRSAQFPSAWVQRQTSSGYSSLNRPIPPQDS